MDGLYIWTTASQRRDVAALPRNNCYRQTTQTCRCARSSATARARGAYYLPYCRAPRNSTAVRACRLRSIALLPRLTTARTRFRASVRPSPVNFRARAAPTPPRCIRRSPYAQTPRCPLPLLAISISRVDNYPFFLFTLHMPVRRARFVRCAAYLLVLY